MSETVFVCSNCGNEYNKWLGQCPACKEWNTLKEITNSQLRITNSRNKKIEKKEAIRLGTINKDSQSQNSMTISTQIGEFDRVLGKGIVQGEVVLFAGEPGIGKSTLLTQLIGKIGGLYVAGEESVEQIWLRVKRLGFEGENIDVLETNDIEDISEYLDRTNNVYKLVIVDSIQTMASSVEATEARAGSVNAIKGCAFRLIELAKRLKVAIIIVGHVTKEGEIAGPRLLEHMVDTVLYFEGEKSSDLRILRVNKNRFGPTDEVGIFRMMEKGLIEVRGSAFAEATADKEEKVGAVWTVVMEGTRPVMVEIQALVVESFAPMPKRVFSGIDYNRGQLLVAVAQKSLGLPLYKYDVFLAVTGGLKIEDTGADLAIIGAMWSSYKNKPIINYELRITNEKEKRVVLIGEVSLLGEVKKVKGWEKRVKEAEGLGRRVVEMKNVREMMKG